MKKALTGQSRDFVVVVIVIVLAVLTASMDAAAGGGAPAASPPPAAGGGVTLGDVLFWIGIAAYALGWFMMMGAAFEVGIGWVFLSFLCPPLFALFRWKEAVKGFLMLVGGVVLFCVGMHLGVTIVSKSLIEMIGPLQTLRNLVSDVSPEERNRGSAYDPATKKDAAGYGQHREGGPEVAAPMVYTASNAPPKTAAPPPPKDLDAFTEKSLTPPSVSITPATPTTLPLIEAAKAGDAAQVARWLDQGEAVNALDADGWTALMHAASKGSVEVVQALLDKGADANAKDPEGWTALMLASYGGNRTLVQSLLDNGADVKAVTKKKTTPLIGAAGSGHAEVVQALVDAKAEVDAKDADGKTALQYATEKKHAPVVEILKKAGAKE